MKNLLTEDQIILITEELAFLKEYDFIDFSDIDTDILEKSLHVSPLSKYLPETNEKYKEGLPEKDHKGQYVYSKEGKNITVPPKFVDMVDYVFRNFSGAGAFLPSQNIFELIWDYVEQFVHLPFEWKKNLLEQISDILSNSTRYQSELIKNLEELKKKHDNDSVYEMTLILPDCYSFLCTILTDPDVSMKFKAEISLSLIYLTSPIDFIPEGLIAHPVALMDDLGILTFVIKKGMERNLLTMEHFKKYWVSTETDFKTISDRFNSIEAFLGKDFFDMIFGYFKVKMGKESFFS
ncbi:MAG: DUF1232 domain-containing protein [Desulfobacterales bacterium]|nr:DUF1232 domain-containing protein [Desulfobacterales bacterium]MCP4159650.1 DUF1232 domain-containing protein [Deltaproteobacteria bacterium]